MVAAAVLDGAIFGDHCSLISDTTIMSSLSSGCDHVDHVKTQLPYALLAMVVAGGFYLIMGYSGAAIPAPVVYGSGILMLWLFVRFKGALPPEPVQ